MLSSGMVAGGPCSRLRRCKDVEGRKDGDGDSGRVESAGDSDVDVHNDILDT
jgi:hypothetical protein